MKNATIYSFLMLFVFFSCKNEDKKAQPLTIGQLTISKEYPKPGDDLDLIYNSDKEIEGFYVYLVGDKNYPVDIDFSKNGDEQKAAINIPDSAVSLAFIIKKDEKFDDNNEKGYLIPLFTENNEQMSGSKAASAFYSTNYGADYGIKMDQKSAVEAIKTDLTTDPELKSDWDPAYLQLAYRNNPEEGKKLIDKYLSSLSDKTDKSEKEYTSMLQFYTMTGEQSKVDATKKEALEKFPKGNTANYDMVEQFQKERDLNNKVAIFDKYAKANSKLGNLGNYMASNLADTYYQQKDMAHFEKYVNMMDDKNRKASIMNNIAWPMAEKGENLEQAEKMSKTSLDLISELEQNPKDKPGYYTKKQYKNSLQSTYRMYADTYAHILFKQGKTKEAITYQEKALDPKGRDVETNERYIEYLMADDQYETVADKAENFIKWGHGNAKINEAYKTAYLKLNPSAKDVDEKLAAFGQEAHTTQVAEIKKTILDEEAPTFILKDMQGKDVSLEALKGKTVILDFWATWCGPCKASFPGMQKVVEKYKADDKVVVLFVDTFERGENKGKMVENFIKANKYDFHVVYDTEIDGGNNFEVADKYGITGIPTKVIIGPDGRMKFKSVGYNGSNEKLVKEMDIMIEILKS